MPIETPFVPRPAQDPEAERKRARDIVGVPSAPKE